ncbi:hypothetical protein LMG8286_01434 [Campylobacter suis]|uniref:Uncharacterized protein n=2 Tax=Campylobacter suis TaxID=2790657 RepID=A0ABN7K817_9BACT|nr:hypothetical protein LMG8286_01434 [Campylobacter suis]
MGQKRGGSLLPLTYIFGSFIGAAMIAVVFAYNNYRFSRYKFVDFSNIILYKKSDIFEPSAEKYLLVVYSSNQNSQDQIFSNISTDLPIVAVDIMQKRAESNASVSFVSSDINTILKLMNTLNITQLPSSVELVQNSDKIYKQDSAINKF